MAPAKAPSKSRSTSGSVKLSPIEALELRQLEFSLAIAHAAYEKALSIRNQQAITIAKAHGIDLAVGGWHIDADAAQISRREG